jgi:Uma2 family endonuclease
MSFTTIILLRHWHHSQRLQIFPRKTANGDAEQPPTRSDSSVAIRSLIHYGPRMATAEAIDLISVDDYLEGEKRSDVRREYLNGIVVAMAGASRRHNTIALNIASALNSELKGKSCRPFMGDLKVGIERGKETLFYYPDIVVECATVPPEDDYYTREPKVIVEVLSPSTERIDRREKFWAYMELDSFEEYVLVDQEKACIEVFRRANDWQPETVQEMDAILQLSSIAFEMPVADVYAGVDL